MLTMRIDRVSFLDVSKKSQKSHSCSGINGPTTIIGNRIARKPILRGVYMKERHQIDLHHTPQVLTDERKT